MADIELVIRISEEEYEECKQYGYETNYYERAIANGIPLPKGHGRLIDANALLMDFAFANNKSAGECVNDAPTVIDKESEE